MTRYLLDTNIASDILRSRPGGVKARAKSLNVDAFGISTITEAELRFGIERMPEATALASLVVNFLQTTNILAWDSAAAQEYARIRARTERTGRTISALDLQIAAHALSLGAILVTRDRVFHEIAGLVCEDWTQT